MKNLGFKQLLSLGLMVQTALMIGCSTVKMNDLHSDTLVSTPIEERYYHVDIPSFDGTIIKATVFQPALDSYDTAPMILHSHGWATWRMKRTVGLHGTFMVHGKAGLQAWKKGYWVISMDHRGFGESGGEVHIMDPDVEVRDAMAVIDWATENLPRLAYDDVAKKDPKVGMLGESYGGQMQLLASIKDPRIDAIVPMTTWYDLAEAIAPNGHLKSFWSTIFFGAGTFSSFFDFKSIYKSEYMRSFKGTMTPELKELLYEHSMAAFCERGEYPQADTLLIQGFRDTIFPINHAIENHRCTKKGTNAKHQRPNDTRLLVMQGGHLLPTQRWTGLPIFNTEKTIHCENQEIGLTQVMLDWFDAKLLDQPEKVAHVPEICMTQDYDSGIIAKEIPVGGEEIVIEKNTIRPGVSGMFEVVARPVDWLTSIPKSLLGGEKPLTEIEKEAKKKGGLIRPAFVPLKIADRDGVLTGIPTAELLLDSEKEDITLFTALGIKKPNKNTIQLLSEQVQPISGRGYHTTHFPGMSGRLERGDVIGLVVYGASGQYFLNRSYTANKAEISGSVNLPLLRKSGQEYIAYSSPEPIDNIASTNVVVGTGESDLPSSAVSVGSSPLLD